MDDIDELISNEMNSKNGTKSSTQQASQPEQPPKSMMKFRKQPGQARDNSLSEDKKEEEFEISQSKLDASGPALLRPNKMGFKKAPIKSNNIDDLIQNEMNNKTSIKKTSVYDSLKPSFKRKPAQEEEEQKSQADAEPEPQQPVEGSTRILAKPSIRPMLKKKRDEDTLKNEVDELIKGVTNNQSNISVKPFDRKTPFNMNRKQIPIRDNSEEKQDNSHSGEGKTFNIKKKIEIKQKQAINYAPIKAPQVKDEEDEYAEKFDDYVEESEIVAKPNIPVPQKGQIDWKEQERLQKEENERREAERLKEEERQKEKQRIIQEQKQLAEEERLREIREMKMLEMQSRDGRKGFQQNLLVSNALGDPTNSSNIFQNSQFSQQQQLQNEQPQQSSKTKGKFGQGRQIKQQVLEENNGTKAYDTAQMMGIDQDKGGSKTKLKQQDLKDTKKGKLKEEVVQLRLLENENENPQENYQAREFKAQPAYNPDFNYVYKEAELKINLQIAPVVHRADDSKIEEQRQRSEDLRNLIQLELDTFETLFEMEPSSMYEVYIEKIKAGTLKNSADQSDDNRATQEIQVDLFQQNEFGNQCPEDFTRTFLDTKVNSGNQVHLEDIQEDEEQQEHQAAPKELDLVKQLEDTTKLIEFMNSAFPVFDEILNENSSKQTVKKQISEEIVQFGTHPILSAPFKVLRIVESKTLGNNSTLVCSQIGLENYPEFQVSVIIIYINNQVNKICITSNTVTTVSVMSNTLLVAGTKEGAVQLWDLRESEFYHLNQTNKQIDLIYKNLESNAQQKSIRCPSYSSEFLLSNIAQLGDEQDQFQHYSQVVKIFVNSNNNSSFEFFSLEEFGKVIIWNVLELSNQDSDRNYIEFGIHSKIKMVSQGSIDLTSELLNPDSICSDITFDSEDNSIYVCSSLGVIKADKHGSYKIKGPRLFGDSKPSSFPSCIHTSNQSELLYVGYSDGSIRLFSKNFSDSLLTIQNFTKHKITKVFVNEQINKQTNKLEQDINRVIAADSSGTLFLFDLSKNKTQPAQIYERTQKETPKTRTLTNVHKIEGLNAVEVVYADASFNISSFKWSYEQKMETNLKRIYEDQKTLELIIPTFYHDFDFGE